MAFDGLRVFNTRTCNLWRAMAGQWIIMYFDPYARLHFVYWSKLAGQAWSFPSRELAMEALAIEKRRLGLIIAKYRPAVYRYEAVKEFEDYVQKSHARLKRTVVFLGDEKDIGPFASGKHIISLGPVEDPMDLAISRWREESGACVGPSVLRKVAA